VDYHIANTSGIIRETLLKDLLHYKGLKVNTTLHLRLEMDGDKQQIIESDFYITSKADIILNEEDLITFSSGKLFLTT